MNIHSKKELQNIPTNHSAHIHYKDFMKIHKRCTSKPYYFLTIDTTLPIDNPLRFRKNLNTLIKMTLTDELKILDDKIKANQTRYDLDREPAKISA